jgi:Zn-dependent oligopeptidase
MCLLGCGGLSTQGAKYLKQSEPFQRHLTEYQLRLKQSARLPYTQRAESVRQLLQQVRAQHEQLRQLKPPPSVAAVHRELETLYSTMEEFLQACLNGSGDLSDPKVKKLAEQWAQHLDRLQVELQRLEK